MVKVKGCTADGISQTDPSGRRAGHYRALGHRLEHRRSAHFYPLFIEFTKYSYENPKKFYDTMLQDFKNIYTLDADGNFLEPDAKSYNAVLGSADDWVMLVFSKKN